jgi:hypothetical protein
MTRNQLVLVFAVAAVFVGIAVSGSVIVSKNMDDAVNTDIASTGRDGDPRPNGVQEFQNDKAARGPSTATGSKTGGAVPPASR